MGLKVMIFTLSDILDWVTAASGRLKGTVAFVRGGDRNVGRDEDDRNKSLDVQGAHSTDWPGRADGRLAGCAEQRHVSSGPCGPRRRYQRVSKIVEASIWGCHS